MSLLSPGDQQKLRDAFSEMAHPVRMLFFTQTIGCDTCAETRQILDEIPPLTDKVTIEEANLVLDRDRAAAFGIDRAPALVLLAGDGTDSRIRFVGAPSGYEFIALVQALLLVGGRPSGLSDANRQRLGAVTAPVTMQVFTTPT